VLPPKPRSEWRGSVFAFFVTLISVTLLAVALRWLGIV
jgi:hypothetical protein